MSSRFFDKGKEYIKCPCDGLNEWESVEGLGISFKCKVCKKTYALKPKVVIPRSEEPKVKA